MTTRTVIIKSSEEKGQSIDGGLFGDTSPDREEYKLDGINCTPEEFLEWFLCMPEGDDFCTSGSNLIDIGGSSLDLSVGSSLSVEFNEYFAIWIERQKEWLINQIRIDTMAAYDKLNIVHWQGDPLCLMKPKERLTIAFHMHRVGELSQILLDEYLMESKDSNDDDFSTIDVLDDL